MYIEIALPASFCGEAELSAAAKTLRLADMGFPFEFDGKAAEVFITGENSRVTLNCGIDMDMSAERLPSAIEINQINASSKLRIPQNAKFFTKIKGANRITFTENGKPAKYKGEADADNRIELAGMNAELVIDYGV